MSDVILQNLENGLLTITMNRPERKNAMSPDFTLGLLHAAQRASDDPEVRAVLLKGAGGTFCVGGDVRGIERCALTHGRAGLRRVGKDAPASGERLYAARRGVQTLPGRGGRAGPQPPGCTSPRVQVRTDAGSPGGASAGRRRVAMAFRAPRWRGGDTRQRNST